MIGGNVGGIPLQIEDGVSGFLVDSPEGAAQRSIEILEDPELAKRLGRTGKEHVRASTSSPPRLPARLARPLYRAGYVVQARW